MRRTTKTGSGCRKGAAWGLSMLLLAGPLAPTARAQLKLPRDLELELAASALPAHLRDEATIYVFDPRRGFEVAREGTNGFHAFVARTDPAVFRGDWEYREHPADVLLPIAFDAAGARRPMRTYFDAHALWARGTAAPEVKRILRERFDSGHYGPHERAGVSYMLSPVLRAFADPYGSPRRVTRSVPHRMFYAPGVENADIGGDPRTGEPFVIQPGPHGYIVMRAHPAERAAIREEYRDLLTRLCGLNELWCVPDPPAEGSTTEPRTHSQNQGRRR